MENVGAEMEQLSADTKDSGKSYKFGDITKSVGSKAAKVGSGVVPKDYQFGDVTKSVGTGAAKVGSGVVKGTKEASVKNYHFGDISKSVVSEVSNAETKALEAAKYSEYAARYS